MERAGKGKRQKDPFATRLNSSLFMRAFRAKEAQDIRKQRNPQQEQAPVGVICPTGGRFRVNSNTRNGAIIFGERVQVNG